MHACIVFMYKNIFYQIMEISNFKWWLKKKILDGQEKSNFKNFQTHFGNFPILNAS